MASNPLMSGIQELIDEQIGELKAENAQLRTHLDAANARAARMETHANAVRTNLSKALAILGATTADTRDGGGSALKKARKRRASGAADGSPQAKVRKGRAGGGGMRVRGVIEAATGAADDEALLASEDTIRMAARITELTEEADKLRRAHRPGGWKRMSQECEAMAVRLVTRYNELDGGLE